MSNELEKRPVSTPTAPARPPASPHTSRARRRGKSRATDLLDALHRLVESLPAGLSWLSVLTGRLRSARARHEAVLAYCELLANRSTVMLPSARPRERRTPVPISQIFVDPPLEVVQDAARPADSAPGPFRGRVARAPVANPPREPAAPGSVAERLGPGVRLLVEGERGSGKSTLIQWLAYTLALRRLEADPSASGVPRPRADWLPLLVTCRDLGAGVLQDSTNLEGILQAQLAQLRAGSWVAPMLERALAALEEGRALLLVDGIDEVPGELRDGFCRLLARTAAAYPDAPIVVTSLPSGWTSVHPSSWEAFERVRLSPLGLADKRRFADRWARAVAPAEAAELADGLSLAVTGDGNLARLTENVQMLSLVAELHLRAAAVPDQRPELVKRAVEVLLDRGGGPGATELTWNETFPALAHLAYVMRRERRLRLWEPEILALLDKPALGLRRTPGDFLSAVVDHTGLLVDAGMELDARGTEQRGYRFAHQTFHDFFAAKAMLHGHDRPGEAPTPRRQQLLELLEDLRIEAREITVFRGRRPRETVFADEWQDTFRQYLAGLDRDEAGEALFTLLDPPVACARPGEARARAVFAAACLADEERVTPETADAVVAALVANVDHRMDGYNQGRNTALDEAAYALARSSWRTLLHDRLLEAYIQTRGSVRTGVGSVLSFAIIGTEPGTEAMDIPALRQALAACRDADVPTRTLQLLRVMSFAFARQPLFREAERTEEVQALADDLLACLGGPEPVVAAALWALAWVVQARSGTEPSLFRLREDQAAPLVRFITSPGADPHALYFACLCASRCEGVFDQPDWIYEWALVADGAKAWKDLPRPFAFWEGDDLAQPLRALLRDSVPPRAREGAALALGRMGACTPEAVDDLARVFLDESRGPDLRDEALACLVHAGGEAVERTLWNALAGPHPDGETYLAERGFLGLLGLGSVASLERLVHENPVPDVLGDARLPAAMALAGHTDARARQVLVELARSSDPAVRAAADDALAGRKPAWTPEPAVVLEPENLVRPQPEHRETLEKVVCVLLVRGENPDGTPIFAYVAVRADRVPEFMEAQRSGLFFPEDYGVIVEAGEGEPSEEIRRKMEEEYGFNHQAMLDLPSPSDPVDEKADPAGGEANPAREPEPDVDAEGTVDPPVDPDAGPRRPSRDP